MTLNEYRKAAEISAEYQAAIDKLIDGYNAEMVRTFGEDYLETPKDIHSLRPQFHDTVENVQALGFNYYTVFKDLNHILYDKVFANGVEVVVSCPIKKE